MSINWMLDMEKDSSTTKKCGIIKKNSMSRTIKKAAFTSTRRRN